MRRYRVNITLRPELVERLRAVAAADGRSLSSWVERRLEADLDALEDVERERLRMVPRYE